MRIGISCFIRSERNIWASGLDQNIVFLANLFDCLPFVTSVVLIGVGEIKEFSSQEDPVFGNLPLVTMHDATELVDVIIEMGGALDIRWLDLMRARGKKVVYHCCGQPYMSLAESTIFRRSSPDSRPDRCDEIWYLPKDAAFAPMLSAMHRCDVFEVPFIWAPKFVDAANDRLRQAGGSFGYRRRPSSEHGLHVAVFEPNVSVVKNSAIPMLICDEAYRTDAQSVTFMSVMNMRHIRERSTAQQFLSKLDLCREHKAAFYQRHEFVNVMARSPNAVVSHQWQNEQNYLYLDVLYGGYPLIHNSPWLKDAGYFYPDFDVQQGVGQLRRAASQHEQTLDDYRTRAQRVFDAVNPFGEHNLVCYAERLLHLCQKTTLVGQI
ncbi:DUF2827 family protein [Burkholderia latens]|uniref:DUF2827 family protein n=1 Tax=Burkholderia latens TaxID=488446 RepID=UPI00158BFC5A|nr:DUF2827 family protein [Burkholderia latens]